MAIREARVYFRLQDKNREVALSKELWTDFTFYMDAVMRGRFKQYSGPEVKGVNLVNLMLFDREYLQNLNRPRIDGAWRTMLNVYECETEFNFSALSGTKPEKILILVRIFLHHAKESTLPQMQALVSHIEESIGVVDIQMVIDEATQYKEKLREKRSSP